MICSTVELAHRGDHAVDSLDVAEIGERLHLVLHVLLCVLDLVAFTQCVK